MTTETQLITQAKNYFEKLGYPSDSIMLEQRRDDYINTDLEIQLNGTTFLILEMKSSKVFNFDSVEEIKYHPSVRKLQKDAHELEASYFVLYDGNKFFWFKTGESGRPESVSPINFGQKGAYLPDKDLHIFNILNFVTKKLKKSRNQQEVYYLLSLLIYKSLFQKLHPGRDVDFDYEFDFLRNAERGQRYLTEQQQDIFECFRVIDSLNLVQNKEALIRFIKETLTKAHTSSIELPSWLPDFMVALGGDNIITSYDVFSRRGAITLSLYSKGVFDVRTIYDDNKNTFWIYIIQLLYLGNVVESQSNHNILRQLIDQDGMGDASHIFLSPPFNARIDYDDYYFKGVKDIASLSILHALRGVRMGAKIIAIVPDSLLLSSHHQRFRHELLINANVEAIISLPNNSFLPNSSVKASLLVLNNKSYTRYTGTFMAFMSYENKGISLSNSAQILSSLSLYYSGERFKNTLNGFIANQLSPNGISVSKYWVAFADTKVGDITQKGYFLISLKELALSIKKGKPINIDETGGEVPFLGPASVRKLELIYDKASYTSRDKIPAGASPIDEGDIVINTISNHRGEAALVTQTFSGMLVNKHIISVKPNVSLINPAYLAIALNSEAVKNQFLIHSTGSVIKFLTLGIVKDVLIPVPGFDEQERVVEEYDSLSNQIDFVQKQLSELQLQLNRQSAQLGKEIVI